MSKVEKIFNDDETTLMKVSQAWTKDELLSKEGIFFLKDVVHPLGLKSEKVIKIANQFLATDISPWEKMGVRKIWNHWAVRMKLFAPYYREHLVPIFTHIDPNWNGNDLLAQKGIFLLSEACQLLPFTVYQIRYQIKKCENSKEEYGCWKDPNEKRFLVDMAVFSQWIKCLARGDYSK